MNCLCPPFPTLIRRRGGVMRLMLLLVMMILCGGGSEAQETVATADASAAEAAALRELFGVQGSRQEFVRKMGRVLAGEVSAQTIAEAKMHYGLQADDAEYLVQNLAAFEKALTAFDPAAAVKYRREGEFAERVAHVRELQASGAGASGTVEERLRKLEEQVKEYQRLLVEAEAAAAATPPAPGDDSATPAPAPAVVSAPPATAPPPASAETAANDPAQGDPGLWPLVTKKSLGRAFIPGKGWLQIGPRGPIDSGRGQVVGRVTPQEEMRARERARRYSAQTSAYAAQQRLANQYRARLISEISELNDMVEGLRR